MKSFLLRLIYLIILLSACISGWSEEYTIEKLDKFRIELTKTYKEYLETGISREVDLYPIALARIQMAFELYSDDPHNKEAEAEFEMIQLLSEAAKIQMIAAKNHATNLEVQEEIEVVLREINEAVEETNTIKQKLAQEEAKRIQQELEERRNEAEKRFYELNNEFINVKKDARGTIISMSYVLFDVGTTTLSNELKISLAKVAGILLVYRDSQIKVEGHTDNTGTAELNQTLSEQRARNVMEFLIEIGVERLRLSSSGYGMSRPDASNETEEGRKINRRVDIIVSDF